MKKLSSLVVTSVLLLLFGATLGGVGGCGGGTGGGGGSTPSIANGLDLPPGTNAILSVRTVTSSAPPALTIDTGSGTLELTTCLLGIDEIELETAETADNTEVEIDLEGPFVVDCVNETVENLGTSNVDDDADDDGEEDSEDTDDDNDGVPDAEDDDDDNDDVADADDSVMDEIEILDAVELVPGCYAEIEADLDRIDVEDGIDPASPLAGNSLFLEGTLDGQCVRVIADFDEEFEIESDPCIEVTDTSITSFILSFNPGACFQGLDLSGATTDAEGCIVLSNDSNQELFQQCRDNVKAAAEFENDEDGDGIPDDEDTD